MQHFDFPTVEFFWTGISNFGTKNQNMLRVMKRGGGGVGWLGFWATFWHVCHGKKKSVPLGFMFIVYVHVCDIKIFLWLSQ